MHDQKGKNNRYALVTGATSGIGYEFARLLAKDGYNLVIVARMPVILDEVAIELSEDYGVKVVPLMKDLFQPEAAVEVYEAVKSRGITVDILINDAGQGEYGKFVDIDLSRDIDLINLNVMSLVVLTKLFLRDMLDRNEGKILQLASVVGKIPSPLMAVYSGTKAFVHIFTESLIQEVKDTNVTITALLPGATDTDFFHKAHEQDSKLYKETDLADPAKVARDGYEALMEGESKVVSGTKNKMQVAMAAVTPDETLSKMMKKQMKPSDKGPGEGRTRSTHSPSERERETIRHFTGSNSGDISTE